MLKKILIGLVAVVVVFAIVVAMQPSDFRISRSATIAAPPAEVFAAVNDFHNWEAWSPWAKLDPNSKVTFDGPPAGKGTVFTWSGNNEVGEGKMTILKSKPNDLIHIQFDFVRPFAGTDLTEFTFKPEGDKTRVTWTMTGHSDFVHKAICLVMNADKMVGGQFEKGLENMRVVVEQKPAPGQKPTQVEADGVDAKTEDKPADAK